MWRFAWMVAVNGIGVAYAAPLKEQLTKDEIKAASEAAVAALPKVDSAAASDCQAKHKQLEAPDPKPDEIASAARCFRAAGSLGASVQLWRTLIQRHPNSKEAVEATRALGPAYEAAGRFDQAAESNATYAKKYPKEPDALDRMTRAVCTWRQLGIADEAERGFKFLQTVYGAKRKLDSATLCDQVRPIVVPPKP